MDEVELNKRIKINQFFAQLIELESADVGEAWRLIENNIEIINDIKSSQDNDAKRSYYRINFRIHIWFEEMDEAMKVFEEAVKSSCLPLGRDATLFEWTYAICNDAKNEKCDDVVKMIESFSAHEKALTKLSSVFKAERDKKQLTENLLPQDEFLKGCYKSSSDDPFGTYSKIAKKKKLDLDSISIQHFCIRAILGDLDEHGDANLEEYGDGDMTISDFKKLDKELSKQLKVELKKSDDIPQFWKYKRISSLDEV